MAIDKQLISKNVDQLNAFEKRISAWSFNSGRTFKAFKVVVYGTLSLIFFPLFMWIFRKIDLIGILFLLFLIFAWPAYWLAKNTLKSVIDLVSPPLDTQAFILGFLEDYQTRAFHPSAMQNLKANIKDMGFVKLDAVQHWVREEREYALQMFVHAGMNKNEQKTRDFLNG